MNRRRVDAPPALTRAELINKERARSRIIHRFLWTLGLGAVGIRIALPSLSDAWPYLAALTGNEWLIPLIAGYFAISAWTDSRMPKCAHCRRAINGPIAIATDRCAACGEIVVDDPRLGR
jgi:hypothetical protein